MIDGVKLCPGTSRFADSSDHIFFFTDQIPFIAGAFPELCQRKLVS